MCIVCFRRQIRFYYSMLLLQTCFFMSFFVQKLLSISNKLCLIIPRTCFSTRLKTSQIDAGRAETRSSRSPQRCLHCLQLPWTIARFDGLIHLSVYLCRVLPRVSDDAMASWRDRYAHSNFIPSPHSINRLKNFIQKYGICAHSHYSLSWKLAPCACSSHTEKENGSERNGSWMKWNLQQRYKFPKGRRSVQQTFPTMRCTRLA